MSEEYEIADTYPEGLKPWDGHPEGWTVGFEADVVILTLKGRVAREYAFNFAADAMRVLGGRESYLERPKRNQWKVLPSHEKPWVPWEVLTAAMKHWQAGQTAAYEQMMKVAPSVDDRSRGLTSGG